MPGTTMPLRRVTVAEVEPSPSEYPVEFSVEMLRDRATIYVPPKLEVTAANPDGPALVFGVGAPGVFDGIKSVETPGLLLVTPHPPYPRRSDCPQPIQEYPIMGTLHPLRLPAGSQESATFHVWAKHANDAEVCYPEGTYSFTTTYTGWDDGEDKFDWGFTLLVETAP